MPDCTYLYTRSDYDQQDSSLLPTQLAHFPAGTASRLSVHFSQMLLARRFQAFDFGVKGNLLRYDQPVPPTIDLARVKPPHALYVARVSIIVSVRAYNLPNYRVMTISANLVTTTCWSVSSLGW